MLTRPRKMAALAAVTSMLWLWNTPGAHAVSDTVRTACGGDYTAYCAMYAVGSKEVRACMRVNRQRLSPRCRHALVTSREATPADKRRYERETGRKAR